jgi:hypothetical protein
MARAAPTSELAPRPSSTTKEGKAKVKALQKFWTGSGALYEAEEEDEKTRKKKLFIRVRNGDE